MASIRKQIITRSAPAAVWDAARDVGALHTRLVPGFVIATVLEPGGRRVSFANGMTMFEPIVSIDDVAMRLAWSSKGGRTSHYNASLEVLAEPGGGSRVVWIADFLPDAAAEAIDAMMTTGAKSMQTALDSLVGAR